ncbi:hypothetical protein PG997_011810 [Apiospora hydei]|uniref:Carboxylesterase type B domain-containing protein n=1 Tax=Apiospora hydei TaxID=1337664 RepID=A0ABR1V1N4_9PEZI
MLLSRQLLLSLAAGLAAAVDSLVDLNYTKVQGAALANGATQWLGVRYAAAPLGDLRFAAPIDPPADPRAPCASDFTMKPNKRFTVAEDCLFLNIFAPSHATATTTKRPVLYFIQGGGFQSNSNANFNGSDLAASGDIVVVQINYRVGPFGFAQSKEVQAGGSLNNGLKDMVQGLQWVKKHIAQFGGDPEQVVAAGDSAGATGVALLLAAFAEKDPGLFRGAIMESPSVATLRTLAQGQEQYDCLANATGCLGAADSLGCLRGLDAAALLTEQCQFNPHLDGDLVKTPMLDAFAKGQFLRVPVIAGACGDEGTKNVPKDTDTVAAARGYIQDQASGALSNSSLDLIEKVYLDAPQPIFAGAGRLWRQLANAHGDFRSTCITAALVDGLAAGGINQTYSYRYAVRDPEQDALGFGAYHTVELNGVFGPNNTDGAPPKSYRAGESNAGIVPVTMAYWASFVQTLDPNAMRATGAPEWRPWTVAGRERLRFETADMGMEAMNDTQRANCDMFGPMLPAMETPLDKPGSVVLTRKLD